jgi:hypothetical protein
VKLKKKLLEEREKQVRESEELRALAHKILQVKKQWVKRLSKYYPGITLEDLPKFTGQIKKRPRISPEVGDLGGGIKIGSMKGLFFDDARINHIIEIICNDVRMWQRRKSQRSEVLYSEPLNRFDLVIVRWVEPTAKGSAVYYEFICQPKDVVEFPDLSAPNYNQRKFGYLRFAPSILLEPKWTVEMDERDVGPGWTRLKGARKDPYTGKPVKALLRHFVFKPTPSIIFDPERSASMRAEFILLLLQQLADADITRLRNYVRSHLPRNIPEQLNKDDVTNLVLDLLRKLVWFPETEHSLRGCIGRICREVVRRLGDWDTEQPSSDDMENLESSNNFIGKLLSPDGRIGVVQAARYFNVSRGFLYRLIHLKKIKPHESPKGSILLHVGILENYLKEHRYFRNSREGNTYKVLVQYIMNRRHITNRAARLRIQRLQNSGLKLNEIAKREMKI